MRLWTKDTRNSHLHSIIKHYVDYTQRSLIMNVNMNSRITMLDPTKIYDNNWEKLVHDNKYTPEQCAKCLGLICRISRQLGLLV